MQPSERAPGLILGEGVELPDDVHLGAYVVIHPGTVVGAGCVVQDRVVLGKPPKLAAHSRAPRDAPPPLVLSSERTHSPRPFRIPMSATGTASPARPSPRP